MDTDSTETTAGTHMRHFVRLIFFALALLVGLAAWHVLARAQAAAQQASNRNTAGVNVNTDATPTYNMNGNMSLSPLVTTNVNANGVAWGEAEDPAAGAAPPTVTIGEAKSLWGYASVRRLTLRSGPDADAHELETLELPEYDGAEILEAKRESLRVRFAANLDAEGGTRARDCEGWVRWGEVVPYASAIVIDAESGEVAARVPLPQGLASVSFSPDGKRAIFYGTSAQSSHGEGGATTAVELDLETYSPLRTFETDASGGFAALVDDGEEIYALVQQLTYRQDGTDSRLRPFRIKGDRVVDVAEHTLPQSNGELVLAPDARTALFMHGVQAGADSRRVDLIDLKAFEARGSFWVEGGGAEGGWPGEYTLSGDGSEFYYRNAGAGGKISVINTQTGRLAREIRPRIPAGHWLNFWQNSVAGDWLLARVAREDDAEGVAHPFWVKPDGETVAAERGLDNVVEAGGALYGVNNDATRFFKLGADRRVSGKFRIARPDDTREEPRGEADDMTIMGISASPDGKRVVVFLGLVGGC